MIGLEMLIEIKQRKRTEFLQIVDMLKTVGGGNFSFITLPQSKEGTMSFKTICLIACLYLIVFACSEESKRPWIWGWKHSIWPGFKIKPWLRSCQPYLHPKRKIGCLNGPSHFLSRHS